MARKLKDIELQEVSLVDKAANKKKFLFFKQEGVKPATTGSKKLKKKINLVIDSDGTVGGTTIAVNGDDLDDLQNFSFSFWNGEDASRAISCSYSKFVEDKDGFSRSETFYLSKGDLKMHPEIQKQLKSYFGETEEIDFEKAEESDAIAKALETINEYQGDFPDDLKKAVGTVAKQAGMYMPQGDSQQVVEKVGAKLSKDTLKKIQDALATLKAILPQLEDKTEKSDVEKAIEDITKKIESLEKKKDTVSKGDESGDKLTKILAELTKRLEVVEKGTGVKKGIDGQDNDDDVSGDTKWPSLTGGKASS